MARSRQTEKKQMNTQTTNPICCGKPVSMAVTERKDGRKALKGTCPICLRRHYRIPNSKAKYEQRATADSG